MSDDFYEVIPKEDEPKIMEDKNRKCFSCGLYIDKGEMCVRRRSDGRCRHEGCKPRVVTRKKKIRSAADASEEEIRRALREDFDREIHKRQNTGKRRRTGGHGYSGGDGYSDI